MFVYVYGNSTVAGTIREALHKRAVQVLDQTAEMEALAECSVALLCVDSLAHAEKSLRPVEGLRSLFKILIVTDPKLYPVYRKMGAELVLLTRQKPENLDWLIADLV
ncbi:hypothetical protein [Tumebacillus permanentifrigoris]|uniref:Uncharacterized protein n=1 Tax=Tumebacillus permanentifrigoris TaxID=378543 RepID=A0A316DB64_9BACL|nr:hypothetical protein [Tumebacillus permanentifrigoris]PWK15042.1 hypothetical protein C7459_104248 [Tumebacillus permanentifrigoris]